MRTEDVEGHKVQWKAMIFHKLYLFCIDIEGTYYMVKVAPDGHLTIL